MKLTKSEADMVIALIGIEAVHLSFSKDGAFLCGPATLIERIRSAR